VIKPAELEKAQKLMLARQERAQRRLGHTTTVRSLCPKKERVKEHPLYNQFKCFRYNGRKKHGVCDLTFDDWLLIRSSSCAYGGGRAPDVYIGPDRKDSSKGYTKENVVPCCPAHNSIKSSILTYEQMLKVVEVINVPCSNATRPAWLK